MARARAPGKLVLSGAYSVLWGAPALVTAVSRHALADADAPAVHVAEEVRAAVELGLLDAPCLVNADELRTSDGVGGSRKLGLGSSAAILVATLFAKGVVTEPARAFELAFDVHRRAQGGGSGIDIAASVFGGTRSLLRSEGGPPRVAPVTLPEGLAVEVFAARESAVTSAFVARVRAFASSSPAAFDPLLAAARAGAEGCVVARTVTAFVAGLDAQRAALAALGDLAGVPIVTSDVRALAALAASTGHAFLPSGAGGGDIAFAAGPAPTSEALRREAEARGYEPVPLSIDARGASEMDEPVPPPRSAW